MALAGTTAAAPDTPPTATLAPGTGPGRSTSPEGTGVGLRPSLPPTIGASVPPCDRCYFTATGFTGEPTAFTKGSGEASRKKSY